jgi:hypothetical protein
LWLFSVNKTVPAGPQLISKLFPQTAVTEDVETAKEQKKQDDEDKKEKESSWKRMKFGYVISRPSILENVLFLFLCSFYFFGVTAFGVGVWTIYDIGW